MEIEEALLMIERLNEELVRADRQIRFWNESYTESQRENRKLKEENRILKSQSLGITL